MLIKSAMMISATLLAALVSPLSLVQAAESEVMPDVHSWQWRHGRDDCDTSQDPVIEVLQVNATSYILRQDKCSHFEAPFIYLLLGTEKALLFDTGATANADEFPIYQTVLELINQRPSAKAEAISEIIVMHSHHHRDHYAGDEQFLSHDKKVQEKITLVGADRESLATQFGMPVSSNQDIELNLGERKINLIPIPGHQKDSVALFDQQTGWLLTGDTLYPGSIRVEDWDEFKLSISRLTAFTEQHQVSAILGGHVEMRSDKSKIYSIGSTFQPKELPLALRVAELVELNAKLEKTRKSSTLRFEKFVISPLNFLERQLMKVLSKKTNQSEVLKHETPSLVGISLDADMNLETGLSRPQTNSSGANKRANAFISHQFQQQSVIHAPVDYV